MWSVYNRVHWLGYWERCAECKPVCERTNQSVGLLLVCLSLFVVPTRCGSGSPTQNQRHQLCGRAMVSWRTTATRSDQMEKIANVWEKNTAERRSMLRGIRCKFRVVMGEPTSCFSHQIKKFIEPWIIYLKFIEICFSLAILWNLSIIHIGLCMRERRNVRTEPLFVWSAFYVTFSHHMLLPGLTSLLWKFACKFWSVWRLHQAGHTCPVGDI